MGKRDISLTIVQSQETICSERSGLNQNRGQGNYRGNNRGNRWGGYKGNQNNRGKPPQKKNANQFKTHIHALITENCEEMPEEEKEKFMTEMAEDF